MTLKEQLGKMEKTELVKIGAKDGTGWFYTGQVGGFRSTKYDGIFEARAKEGAEKAVEHLKRLAVSFPAKDSKGRWGKYSENLGDWGNKFASETKQVALKVRLSEDIKPLNDREVVEVWEADGEKATNILVEGFGDGNKYCAEPLKPLGEIDDEAVSRLMKAIYKPVMDDLVQSYVRKIKAKKSGKKRRDEDVYEERQKEMWLKKDVYGLAHMGGAGLIRECHERAKQICEEVGT